MRTVLTLCYSLLVEDIHWIQPCFFHPATITQPIVTIDEGDVLGITIFVSLTCHRAGRADATTLGSPVADGTGGTVMKEDSGPVGLLGGFP